MSTGLRADDADQHGFAYRFAWGRHGLAALAPVCDVIVVVDARRFSTAVSVAVDRGAVVYPYRWREDAAEYAASVGAVLATSNGAATSSPADLATIPDGSRLVLASPNGSALAFAARDLGAPFVLTGALRNAAATARWAREVANGGPIGVIAAGERWPGDDASLRPCVEDLIGAGAILTSLDPSASVSAPGCSPEAATARAAFVAARPLLQPTLEGSTSGRECIRRGRVDDVAMAADLDASDRAAILVDEAFRSS